MSALFLRTLLAIVIVLSPALASAEGLRVVARVNDDAVTDFDLSQRVLFAIRTTGLQDSPELRQRMAAQILRQMIDERLQIQDAKRLGLKASDAELSKLITGAHPRAGLELLVDTGLAEHVRFDQIRPGCYEPYARLRDMDEDGVWAQLPFVRV